MYLKYYFIECKHLKYVLIIEKLLLAFFFICLMNQETQKIESICAGLKLWETLIIPPFYRWEH